MPCKKCGLQYSSYCVDCVYVKTGLNLNDEEYHEIEAERSGKKYKRCCLIKENRQNDKF